MGLPTRRHKKFLAAENTATLSNLVFLLTLYTKGKKKSGHILLTKYNSFMVSLTQV